MNELCGEFCFQLHCSDFLRHAKRSVISPDDVKLLVRRNPHLVSSDCILLLLLLILSCFSINTNLTDVIELCLLIIYGTLTQI